MSTRTHTQNGQKNARTDARKDGWRKPSPGLLKAAQYAQLGEQLDVPRAKAVGAVKKVSATLGLTVTHRLMLDTLASMTQPQDWETGRRPIVWPSNNLLMDQTGLSCRSVRRNLRLLAEHGLVSMKDSVNGKRWGRRDDDGYIAEAYGIDLSPLAARAQEFEALDMRNREERGLCRSLCNKITIARRVIRSCMEKASEKALNGPWKELKREYERMVSNLSVLDRKSVPSLLDLVDWIDAFRERVEQAFAQAFDEKDRKHENEPAKKSEGEYSKATESGQLLHQMSPMGDSCVPHILTTNQLTSVNSNSLENKANADKPQNQQTSTLLQPTMGAQTDASVSQAEQLDELNTIPWNNGDTPRAAPNGGSGGQIEGERAKSKVEMATIMAACPQFAQMARDLIGGYLKKPNDLLNAAHSMLPVIGISPDAWHVAQQKLGNHAAAAAIALIYEKYANGTISSPGGYLRGMIAKAIKGKLHMDKSFYGQLAQQNKKTA